MKRLLITLLCLIFSACKKGEGAICHDGWRSYSKGQGTCSWHGGIDHYVNPDETDIPRTIFLIISLCIVFFVVRGFRK